MPSAARSLSAGQPAVLKALGAVAPRLHRARGRFAVVGLVIAVALSVRRGVPRSALRPMAAPIASAPARTGALVPLVPADAQAYVAYRRCLELEICDWPAPHPRSPREDERACMAAFERAAPALARLIAHGGDRPPPPAPPRTMAPPAPAAPSVTPALDRAMPAGAARPRRRLPRCQHELTCGNATPAEWRAARRERARGCVDPDDDPTAPRCPPDRPLC